MIDSRAVEYQDEITRPYVEATKAATDLASLRSAIEAHMPLVPDALAVVDSMDERDWHDYEVGRVLEARGRFAGEAWAERYTAIIMPAVLVGITQVALKYNVPDGLALHRLLEAGVLEAREGGVFFKGEGR